MTARDATCTFLLPAAFGAAEAVLLVGFGGAGHGWGCTAFYLIALPAALLGPENVGSITVLGLCQYAVLGALIDAIRGYLRETRRPSSIPHCLTCDYNLTGTLGSRCPECGRPFNLRDSSTFRIGGRRRWLSARED